MFMTKLDKCLIISGIYSFRKHLLQLCFNQKKVQFDSLFCCLNRYFTRQAIIIANVDSQFNFFFRFSTLSCRVVDVSMANKFVPELCSYFSSYYSLGYHILSPFAKLLNDSSNNKPFDCYYYSCFCLLSILLFYSTSKSSSLSGQTKFIAISIGTCSFRPCYSHNSSHRIHTKDNIKIMT